VRSNRFITYLMEDISLGQPSYHGISRKRGVRDDSLGRVTHELSTGFCCK